MSGEQGGGWVRAATALGTMVARIDGDRLRALRFAGEGDDALAAVEDRALALALAGWFADGHWRGPQPAPPGTAFQQQVWAALAALPRGAQTSYRALAATLGRPRAARAVAGALAANPVLLLIPCHRVIGADGALRGYAGGLARKRALIELERPEPRP